MTGSEVLAQLGEASKPVMRMSLAGTPATIALAGTSLVTTAPAPTIAPSPIVTPGTTVTAGAEPDLAADDDGRRDHVGPPVRVEPWFRVVRVLPWPMRVPSPMVMPPVSWKRQPMLMKTSLPSVRFLPNSQ